MTAKGPETLIEMLAANRGDDDMGVRFLDRHERSEFYSIDALWDRACSAAGQIRQRGVVRADRVAIIVPTGVTFYDAFFGALRAGATPVPMYPPVRLGRLDEWVERTAQMLRAADVAAVVADARTRRVLGNVMCRADVPCGVLKAETLHQGPPVKVMMPVPEEDALVQFSSGTTGSPTPVVFDHRRVLANVDAILGALPEEALDGGACVSWLPLYHDMGLIGCVLTSIRGGGPLTLLPPEVFLARPATWLRAISKYGGTVSPAPNFAYARCVEKIRDDEIADVDLSNWVVAMNGAEPISVEAMRAFTERFRPYGLRETAMTPVYGLAEVALAATFSPTESAFRSTTFDRGALSRGAASPVADGEEGVELVSVGRALPGFGVEIRDESDDALPDGRLGRVWVRGPSVTSGYLGEREAPLVDGWLDTGDLGFVHAGDLYIAGRAKDVVIVRGRNHPPHELERPCDRVEGVRTGCVVAVSDVGDDGESVLVFVESRVPSRELGEACRSEIRGACGVDPDLVVVVEPGTLPRTSSGKLRRGETLRRWKAGTLNPPREVTPGFVAGAMARSLVGYMRA